MPALQDVIHKIEVGEWTRYIKVGVAVLGLLAFTVVYDIRQFKNFSTEEAMDNAQLARNLTRGKGYSTDFIRPLSYYLLKRHLAETKQGDARRYLSGAHPDLANPPVYPLLLAGWMKVLPFHYEIPTGGTFVRYEPEVVIAFLNQLLFYGAIVLLFFLALKLFDSAVAWVTAVVFAGTDLFWKFSVSGLPTMLLVVLFLALTWCLVLVEQNSREEIPKSNLWFILMAVATGALIGIGALTRYSIICLLIPTVLFFVLFLGQRRVVLSLVTVATALALLTPWLIRNYNLSGTLFGTAGYSIYQETSRSSGPFASNKLERYMSSDWDVAMAKVGTDHFLRKLVVNSAQIVRHDLLNLAGNWVAGFFLVGLMVSFLNPTLNRLRVFLLFSLVVLIASQALGQGHLSMDSPEINTENLIILVAPLAFLFGVAMFSLLLDQINLPFPPTRTVVTTVFGLVVCAPLIFTMLPPRSIPVAYPPYWPPTVQDVSGWMKADEFMMSDMPWAVAWYGDRKCLWSTLDAPSDLRTSQSSDFFNFHDFQHPIQGILLTRVTTDAKWFSQMIQGQDYAWGKFMLECLLRTNVPTGFPLKHSPPGFLQYGLLFLSDRDRWSAPVQERRKGQQH
jgi:4-amino-4-deoxy-L-arabinose transferase-like glycosyltransferase